MRTEVCLKINYLAEFLAADRALECFFASVGKEVLTLWSCCAERAGRTCPKYPAAAPVALHGRWVINFFIVEFDIWGYYKNVNEPDLIRFKF